MLVKLDPQPFKINSNPSLWDTPTRREAIHLATSIVPKELIALIMEYQYDLYLEMPLSTWSFRPDYYQRRIQFGFTEGQADMLAMHEDNQNRPHLSLTSLNQLESTETYPIDGARLAAGSKNDVLRNGDNIIFNIFEGTHQGFTCTALIERGGVDTPTLRLLARRHIPGAIYGNYPCRYDRQTECFFLGTSNSPKGLITSTQRYAPACIVDFAERDICSSWPPFPFGFSKHSVLVVFQNRIDRIDHFLEAGLKPTPTTVYTCPPKTNHVVVTDHPDDQHLIVAAEDTNNETTSYSCQIFSVSDASKPKSKFTLRSGEEPMAMAANWQHVAVIVQSGACSLWDLNTGVSVTTIETGLTINRTADLSMGLSDRVLGISYKESHKAAITALVDWRQPPKQPQSQQTPPPK